MLGWNELIPPLGPPFVCCFPSHLPSLLRTGPGLSHCTSTCDGENGALHIYSKCSKIFVEYMSPGSSQGQREGKDRDSGWPVTAFLLPLGLSGSPQA